jgi:hypothetical protein
MVGWLSCRIGETKRISGKNISLLEDGVKQVCQKIDIDRGGLSSWLKIVSGIAFAHTPHDWNSQRTMKIGTVVGRAG